MADSTSASEGNVLRTYERGLALYGEDEWSLAARSFDMVKYIAALDASASCIDASDLASAREQRGLSTDLSVC